MNIKNKILMAATCVAPMLTGCEDTSPKFIVDHKINYKIIIHEVGNPENRHMICFVPDAPGYYQYYTINEGDTLKCHRSVNERLVVANRRGEKNNIDNIESVNGKSFNELKEQSILDSVMRMVTPKVK